MPDDPWFDELDPGMKVYMYEHWYLDKQEEYNLLRSMAILGGSFTNPEAAKQMIKSDNPDYESTEEEFLESMRMVQRDAERQRKEAEVPERRRHRRIKALVQKKEQVDG